MTELHEDIEAFLFDHFRSEYDHDQSGITQEEQFEIDAIVDTVSESFHDNVGELGMAINFVVLAEDLSQVDDWPSGFDPEVRVSDVLDRYETKDTNTLTIRYDGEQYGIRPIQNEVRDLFIYDLRRTNFPSSPGHHTGNWPDYDDLLERAFRLSRAGRFEACRQLFELGMQKLEEKRYESREPAFPRPFTEIVDQYPRSHPDENGGLAFQAMVYGYVKANWSHLSLRASKVRTGSQRQNRYGDIDGFYGPNLMISVEVKDLDIDRSNVDSELGTMVQLSGDTTTVPIAVCRSVTDSAREVLRGSGVRVLDDSNLLEQLEQWDYHKQNRAVQGTLHYLANVEEDPDAVQRLLRFLNGVDGDNRVLDHLIE